MTGVAVLLAGCATPPERIKASPVSDLAYQGATCEELAAEATRIDTQLVDSSDKQSRAATGDAIGVILIGVPMSSLGGADREGEIAQLKGEKVAVANERRKKGC